MARRGYSDEDGDIEVAPWLAAADAAPDARYTQIPRSRLVWWIGGLAILLIVVVALIYASVAKPGDEAGYLDADGLPPLIQAPDTPYKVRPEQAGGLDLTGPGQTAYEAADGVDPGGDLDLDAMPEEPLARPVANAPTMPAPGMDAEADVPPPAATATAAKPIVAPPGAPKPAPVVAKPATAKPATPLPAKPKDRLADVDAAVKAANRAPPIAAAGGGTVLQLGAFSTEAKARAAWKNFTSRYGYLSGLEQSILPLARDGATLYRLRATGAGTPVAAKDLCARLKVAGEQCSVTE